MLTLLIRTVLTYIFLIFIMRLMGKRQLGELDIGDLVSTLLISELAAIPIDDPDIPLLNAIIPSLLIISVEIIISTLKNKSERLKRAIEGSPTYIIYKGRLLQSALCENRISVNELLSEMRAQGAFDISDVSYAILEQNGSVSIVKNSDASMAHALVIDGEVMEKSLSRLGYNEDWLKKRLSEQGATLSEVFLMTVSDSGDINIIKKEGL